MTYTEDDVMRVYQTGYTHGIRGQQPLEPHQVLEWLALINKTDQNEKI